MCALYGDIYELQAGLPVIQKGWLEIIRKLIGNVRPEVVSDSAIASARISGSEETERATRRENVLVQTDMELYNLMSKASNYSASAELMAFMNDKQEIRKINIMEFQRITKLIMDVELPTDTNVDTTTPIVGSEYSTGVLAADGTGEGMFVSTKYGKMQW